MTSSAKWIGGMYAGETSDGKCWWTTRRYLGEGRFAHVVRFSPEQGMITGEHRKAARAAIEAA